MIFDLQLSICYAAPMNFSFYLTITILLLVGWTITYPEAALELISTLRHQFRRYVIERIGNQAVQELAQELKAEARRMDIPEAIAEKLIEEHRQEIIERLGNQYTRQLLEE